MLVKANTSLEGFRTPAPQSSPRSPLASDVTGYYHSNLAWNKVKRWRRSKRRAVNKSLDTARRLQSYSKDSIYGPIVADVYSEFTLLRYSRIEISLLAICLFVMFLSCFAALSVPIYFIVTIVSGWLATICYRAYKHHIRCYWYVRMMNSQLCPHCGKSLSLEHGGVDPHHAMKVISEVGIVQSR
jgi:hypothetical protein